MTSLNQEHDGEAPFSYHILTRIQTFSSQSKLSKSVQNYCNLTPPIFGLSKFNPTSTTTWCFPTVNFFPMKLLCAFSVLSSEYSKITKIIAFCLENDELQVLVQDNPSFRDHKGVNIFRDHKGVNIFRDHEGQQICLHSKVQPRPTSPPPLDGSLCSSQIASSYCTSAKKRR